MYGTVDSLFKGICDTIRERDGTTTLIAHQDIPSRIKSIVGGGEGGSLIFIPVQILDLNIQFVNISDIEEEDIIWNRE